MKTAMQLMAAIATAAILGTAGSAGAEDCNATEVAKRRDVIITFLEENPEKEPKFSELVADVEAEYGGKPSREQFCEAMDKVIAGLEKL